MTMKMMSSTSKMSISGTMFISAIAPPLFSPTDIPIVNLLSACVPRALQAIKPRQVGSGAALLTQQTNDANMSGTFRTTFSRGSITRWSGGARWRRRCPAFLLILFRQKAELIDARGADFIHHRDNIAILGPCIALHVDSFIETGGQHVFDLPGDIFLGDLGVLKVDSSVSRDRYDNRVILVGILHLVRIVDPGHIHRQALLQHRRDDHEDDQQDEHDVGHGNNVRRRHLSSDFWFIAHGLPYFFAPRRKMK